MPTHTLRARALTLLTLGAAIFAAGAAPAAAVPIATGTPGAVTIRVEGATGPLVPQTTVTTTTAPISVTDGATTVSCAGTSVASALQTATGGQWGGAISPTFGPSVDTIKGETHLFSSGAYWSVWVNNAYADNGACSQNLAPGDNVLIYVACAGASTGCADNGPLAATLPTTAAPGATLTLQVTQSTVGYDSSYNTIITSAPAAGATVKVGSATATTGVTGSATVTLGSATGPQPVTISKNGYVRLSGSICVTSGSDGACGTVTPGSTPGPASVPETPAALDTSAPTNSFAGLVQGKRFKRGKGPRTLAGAAVQRSGSGWIAEPSGVKNVELRLVRTGPAGCATFDGAAERFVKITRCRADAGRWFSVGKDATWSYLLPARLGPGRYVLDVRITDGAGNVSPTLHTGLNRVIFRVA